MIRGGPKKNKIDQRKSKKKKFRAQKSGPRPPQMINGRPLTVIGQIFTRQLLETRELEPECHFYFRTRHVWPETGLRLTQHDNHSPNKFYCRRMTGQCLRCLVRIDILNYISYLPQGIIQQLTPYSCIQRVYFVRSNIKC